jgi:hypothetical protein
MDDISKLVTIFKQFYVPAIDITDAELFLSSKDISIKIVESLGMEFNIHDINSAMTAAGFRLHMTRPFLFEWMIKKISVLNIRLIE